ncbi:hypothetical protein [Paenibacillus sp. P32E]|uniref:hypothetical protein n=1 Tax=Paenibacillus sp. P32E TaxID=1349434 RepID=UPI00093DFB4B|nr:hypothetical protein [Paenibacillus sp. P32E]OKP91391.1 hypothetical protein A3848_09815 [Paenibacillus sp. P32E]
MAGHIKIDRNIREHWIYRDPEYFIVWFEMLSCARYSKQPKTDIQGDEIYTINYGEFMFGRISWSERLGISEQRLRTLLKKLIKEDMIQLVSTFRRFSIYKVTNYEKFNQQTNQQETVDTEGFDEPINQQINREPTSSQPAANQQPTTKEESKEGSKQGKKVKDNKTYTPEFDEFWNMYPRKLGKVEAFKTWTKVIKNGESSELIIKCATNYATDCENKQTEQQYIKHPKTFLNDERYKDYTLIAVGGGNGGKYGTSNGRYSEATRKAASRGEEKFIGSPGSDSGLSTEEVRRLVNNFE